MARDNLPRQLAIRLRCGRRNERSVELALPGFEIVVGLPAVLAWTKAGKFGERQAIAERVMGERLLGLAATTLAGRFLGRAAESRTVESRVVRRAETFSTSASDGSCATNLAVAGWTSESAAVARVAVRLVEGVSTARKVGRSSESIARELAD